MRAILIDPKEQTIKEVNYSGDFNDIYKLIGNDCHTFSAPLTLENGDTFYCDDEGLYHENIGAVIAKDWHSPIVGRILVLNTDEMGDSVDAVSSIESLQQMLTFIPSTNQQLINYFDFF